MQIFPNNPNAKWQFFEIFDNHIDIGVKRENFILRDSSTLRSIIIITAKYTKTRINQKDNIPNISDVWDIDHGSRLYLGDDFCDSVRQSVNASLASMFSSSS